MRIAVVGCRPPPGNQMENVTYLEILRGVQALIRAMDPGTVVVSGGAAGVDAQAAADARECGLEVVEHRPDYRLGRGAPLVRNTTIVEDADAVFAFPAPWSRGTWDTVRKAVAAGKRCIVMDPTYTVTEAVAGAEYVPG